MSLREFPPGSEFDEGASFIPSEFAAHAVMVTSADPTALGTPCVMLDLVGYLQSDLPTNEPAPRKIRLLIEAPGARGILAGLQKSLLLLENLQRNQEGPH